MNRRHCEMAPEAESKAGRPQAPRPQRRPAVPVLATAGATLAAALCWGYGQEWLEPVARVLLSTCLAGPRGLDATYAVAVSGVAAALATGLAIGFAGVALFAAWRAWRPCQWGPGTVRALAGWGCVAALYLSVSQMVVFASYRDPGFHAWSLADWGSMIEMRGVKRNSTRVFSPWLVRALARSLPVATQDRLREAVRQDPFLASLAARTVGLRGYEAEFAVSVVVMVVFLALAMWALGSLARAFFIFSPVHDRVVIPLGFALFLPILYKHNTFVYDMPTICLTTVGFLLLVRGRLRWFHLLFAFALLNKESFILTSFVFLVLMIDRLPWRRYILCLAGQAVYFVALRWTLALAFRDSEGAFFDNLVPSSFEWLLNRGVLSLLTDLDRTAYVFPVLYIPCLVGLAFLPWRTKHPDLRRMAAVVLLVLLAVNFTLTVFEEWRGFYEVYPLLVLLAYENLGGWLDRIEHRPVLPDRAPDSLAVLLRQYTAAIRHRQRP